MKFGLAKDERLKRKSTFERIFEEGRRLKTGRVTLFYLGGKERKAAFVATRKFKKAVERNRIKRILREAYRINKELFGKFYMVFHADGLLNFDEATACIVELGRKLSEKNSDYNN